MTAYSFQKRFIEPILAGTKRQTIRTERVRGHVRPGQLMQLYTAMRTKHCRLIGTATAHEVYRVTLDFALRHPEIAIDDRVWNDHRDLDAIARLDGFAGWFEMRRFWLDQHGPDLTSWSGVLIRWRDFTTPGG